MLDLVLGKSAAVPKSVGLEIYHVLGVQLAFFFPAVEGDFDARGFGGGKKRLEGVEIP